jgi:hypothetical protein
MSICMSCQVCWRAKTKKILTMDDKSKKMTFISCYNSKLWKEQTTSQVNMKIYKIIALKLIWPYKILTWRNLLIQELLVKC